MQQFRKPWFIAFCFFLLIKPGCISGMPALSVIDSLLNLCRIVLVIYAALVAVGYARKIPKNRLMTVFLLVLLSVVWEPVTTFLNGGAIGEIGPLMNNLGLVFISYLGLSAGYKSFVKGIAHLTGAYIIINCLTVLVFPNGMYATTAYTQNYFLSYRTSWFVIYLLGMTMAMLWDECEQTRKSRIWCIATIVSAILSVCMVWTATSIFSFAVAAIFLAVWRLRNKPGMKMSTMMIVEAIAFWGIIIERMQDKLSFIIVDILHKDITLTARTRIWDAALTSIANHLWTGVGRLGTADMRYLLGYGASHPHCRILYVLMCTGLIGLILYIATLYYCHNGAIVEERKREGQIVSAAFLAMLVASLVESFSATGGYLYPLYMVAASIHLESDRLKRSGVKI